jgi:hypothetical protein
MSKWSEEDKEVARLLLEQGLLPREVSAEINIPENTINGWKVSWFIRSKRSYKELYQGTVGEVQQRLIKIMREAPEVSYNYFNSSSSNVPPATAYRKYFGSWSAALEAAGVAATGQKQDKQTTLYLVEFDGFYKIGITQQTVDQRLGGRYPPYKVIGTIKFESLSEAKQEEKRLLTLIKEYKYIPTDFPVEGRGFTECFKVSKNKLEEIFVKLL